MNAKALTEFFVKRPIIFWSFVVGILALGVICFTKMPKLEDPAVAIKQASVVLVYPGATAHEVELEAVQVMEDAKIVKSNDLDVIGGVLRKERCVKGVLQFRCGSIKEGIFKIRAIR